jgi:hypothetical protein
MPNGATFDVGFLNLVDWLGNVILPTLSGLMLALAVWNFGRGREASHLTWSAFAALAVSGLLREFEIFASRLPYNNPDLVWNALLNLVNWFANVILPVYAAMQFLLALVSLLGRSTLGRTTHFVHRLLSAMGCLCVSSMTRLLEHFVQAGTGGVT